MSERRNFLFSWWKKENLLLMSKACLYHGIYFWEKQNFCWRIFQSDEIIERCSWRNALLEDVSIQNHSMLRRQKHAPFLKKASKLNLKCHGSFFCYRQIASGSGLVSIKANDISKSFELFKRPQHFVKMLCQTHVAFEAQ